MKKLCSIQWIGSPVPQPRHKSRLIMPSLDSIKEVVSRGGIDLISNIRKFFTKRAFISNYDPGAKNKTDFLLEIRKHASLIPPESPIFSILVFTCQRPKSHFGTGKNSAIIKPAFKDAVPTGDIDNYEKFIYDSMNKTFFKDDKQVVGHFCFKLYGIAPSVRIELFQLEPGEYNIKTMLTFPFQKEAYKLIFGNPDEKN